MDQVEKGNMMQDQKLRSIVKAISWRISGTIDTFVLSFLITGKLSYAYTISLMEFITKIVLYYFHERIWSLIKWGTVSSKDIFVNNPVNLYSSSIFNKRQG